jgi:phage shock protein PspC (stress-responsive transcriptional regulator)
VNLLLGVPAYHRTRRDQAWRQGDTAWYRVPESKLLAGVCAGLAEQFGVSATIIRLAFVLGVIVGWGMGLVLYLALWVIMPIRTNSPSEVTTSFHRVD